MIAGHGGVRQPMCAPTDVSLVCESVSAYRCARLPTVVLPHRGSQVGDAAGSHHFSVNANWHAPGLHPVGLQESPDAVGDLLKARLADDQAVVRMRAEWLIGAAQPVGQSFGVRRRRAAVQTGAHHQYRNADEAGPIDGDALEDLALDEARFVRFLTEEVLQPNDVGDREVAVIALELLREGLPTDVISPVDVGDLA